MAASCTNHPARPVYSISLGLCKSCWSKTRPWYGKPRLHVPDASTPAAVGRKTTKAPRAGKLVIVAHAHLDGARHPGAISECAPSQPEAILAELRRVGPAGLDPVTAARQGLGIRLAARVADLRAKGHPIENVNRPGMVARYVLAAS